MRARLAAIKVFPSPLAVDVRTHQGIADVYRNTMKLQDVINITSFPNLDLINTGDEAETISHLLATEKTTEILNELRDHYDYVIVDTPEVGKYVDAIPFLKVEVITTYSYQANKEVICGINFFRFDLKLF